MTKKNKNKNKNEQENVPLIEGDVLNLLEFLSDELFIPYETSDRQRYARNLGRILGVLSPVSVIKITYDFGLRASDFLNIKNRDPLAYYFAATGAIPIAMLEARITSKVFEELVTNKSKMMKKLIIENDSILSYVSKICRLVLATTSSIPITYITYDVYFDSLKYGILPLQFISFTSRFIVYVWALKNLQDIVIDNFKFSPFNKFTNHETDIIYKMEKMLRGKLISARFMIEQISDRQLERELYRVFKIIDIDKEDVTKYHDTVSRKLDILLNPHNHIINTESRNVDNKLRKTITIVAGIIGAVSPFFNYEIAKTAVEDVIGAVTDSEFSSFAALVGGMSVISIGALNGYATAHTFGKFYDYCANAAIRIKRYCCQADNLFEDGFQPRPILKNCLTFLAFILAISSVSARIELTAQYVGLDSITGILLSVCLLIGPMCTDFWSVDRMCRAIVDGSTPRELLITSIDELRKLLPHLKPEYIKLTYDILNNDASDRYLESKQVTYYGNTRHTLFSRHQSNIIEDDEHSKQLSNVIDSSETLSQEVEKETGSNLNIMD